MLNKMFHCIPPKNIPSPYWIEPLDKIYQPLWDTKRNETVLDYKPCNNYQMIERLFHTKVAVDISKLKKSMSANESVFICESFDMPYEHIEGHIVSQLASQVMCRFSSAFLMRKQISLGQIGIILTDVVHYCDGTMEVYDPATYIPLKKSAHGIKKIVTAYVIVKNK